LHLKGEVEESKEKIKQYERCHGIRAPAGYSGIWFVWVLVSGSKGYLEILSRDNFVNVWKATEPVINLLG